ncbi:MAG: hypothetical protein ACXAC5_18025 [Promethearchaeota archaeon]
MKNEWKRVEEKSIILGKRKKRILSIDGKMVHGFIEESSVGHSRP